MSATVTSQTARHQRLAGLDAALAVLLARNHELDRDPEQQQAADQLEEHQRHDLRDDDGENDAEHDRGAGAEQDAPEPLLGRKRAAGERDDDGVVT